MFRQLFIDFDVDVFKINYILFKIERKVDDFENISIFTNLNTYSYRKEY